MNSTTSRKQLAYARPSLTVVGSLKELKASVPDPAPISADAFTQRILVNRADADAGPATLH